MPRIVGDHERTSKRGPGPRRTKRLPNVAPALRNFAASGPYTVVAIASDGRYCAAEMERARREVRVDQVYQAIRRAGARLWLQDVLGTLTVVSTCALLALILARLVERLFGLDHAFAPLWTPIAYGAGGATVAMTLAWTLIRKRRALAVAAELDERAGLKESLSTALYMEKVDDPWARAMLETAAEKARRVDVRGAIPYRAPRLWPVPFGAAAALLIVWVAVPRFDVLGLFARKEQEARKQQEVLEVKQERQADEKKLEDLLERAKVDFKDEPGKDGPEGEQAKELDPEAIRRAAVRDLTSLSEKLQEAREGDKAAQLQALKDEMQKLRQPGQGALSELSRELSKGDFGKAKQALDKLQQQLTNDATMSNEQKQQLKDQMNNLAQQLQKVGESQEQVAKQLEQQGLDKKTAEQLARKAADPEALKKALEELKNMTPEQKEQLRKLAESACKACQNASNLGDAMSKMGQAMSQEGMSPEGQQAMQELAEQLSQMEQMDQEMKDLEAAMSECKGQLAKLGQGMGGKCQGKNPLEGEGGQGEWSEGDSSARGSGSGGPGQGSGPSPDEFAADYQIERKKENTQDRGGQTISSRLVYGEQVRGEAKAQFAEAVTAASGAAAESINNGQVPRELQGAVKHYFGTLRKKANDAKPGDSGAKK